MRLFKLSSVLFLAFFFIAALIPEANAGRRCRSSFGMSFNVGGPAYVVAPAPAPVPVVMAPQPVYTGYAAPAPYPYYYAPVPVVAPAPVIVERPRTYVQPGFSYTYWRR